MFFNVIFIVTIVSIIVFILQRILSWHSKRHGTGKLFRRHKFLKRRRDGLVINGKKRISAKHSFEHLIVCAPTGSGKTTTFTYPNVLTLDHSMVITDLKGEVYELCSGHLADKGFDVQVLDLDDVTQSLHFNPLKRLQSDDEIKAFCSSLFSMSNQGAKTEGIWRIGSIQLVYCIIRCLKNTPAQKYANLANLIHVLNSISLSDSGKQVEGFIAKYAPDQSTFDTWKSFIGSEDKIRAGHLSGAQTILAPYDTHHIRWLTHNDSFDFSSLRKIKTALFLKVPVAKTKQFAPLLTLFYSQLFDHLLADKITAESQSVFCLLEEFGNLMRIDNFNETITLIRSKRVSISIIAQNIDQIDHIYGRNIGETIVTNCGSQIVFPGIKSERTLKFIEMQLGKTTYHEEDAHGNVHVNPRQVMDTYEIRTLKRNQGLYLYSNLPGIRLRMIPLFRNARLMYRSGVDSRKGELIPSAPPLEQEKHPIVPLEYVALNPTAIIKKKEPVPKPVQAGIVLSTKQEKLKELMKNTADIRS